MSTIDELKKDIIKYIDDRVTEFESKEEINKSEIPFSAGDLVVNCVTHERFIVNKVGLIVDINYNNRTSIDKAMLRFDVSYEAIVSSVDRKWVHQFKSMSRFKLPDGTLPFVFAYEINPPTEKYISMLKHIALCVSRDY